MIFIFHKTIFLPDFWTNAADLHRLVSSQLRGSQWSGKRNHKSHNMCYFCSKETKNTQTQSGFVSLLGKWYRDSSTLLIRMCIPKFQLGDLFEFFYVPNILWKIAHEFFTLTLPQGGERRDKPLAVPLCPPTPWSPPIVPLPPWSPPVVPLVPWRPDRICLRHSDVYYSDPLQLVHSSFPPPLYLIGL